MLPGQFVFKGFQFFFLLWPIIQIFVKSSHSQYSYYLLRIFSEYAEFVSAYSQYTNSFILLFIHICIVQMISKKHWEFRVWIRIFGMTLFSSTAFNGSERQNLECGELLDSKPSRNKTFYCFWLTKTLFRVFGLFAEWASNLNMSTKWTLYSKPI
jgi:hypothetical protein